jgi:protein gp37
MWDGAVINRAAAEAKWREPLKWNRPEVIERTGKFRVFCGIWLDFFDNKVDSQWRIDAWDVIRRTTNLRWMILTKRIGNAQKMLPPDWPMPHVGLMATLENQEVWNRDFPKLMAVSAAWHGVSCEPMLSAVDIDGARPDWIICGGESGPVRRNTDPLWVRSLRDQCDDAYPQVTVRTRLAGRSLS